MDQTKTLIELSSDGSKVLAGKDLQFDVSTILRMEKVNDDGSIIFHYLPKHYSEIVFKKTVNNPSMDDETESRINEIASYNCLPKIHKKTFISMENDTELKIVERPYSSFYIHVLCIDRIIQQPDLFVILLNKNFQQQVNHPLIEKVKEGSIAFVYERYQITPEDANKLKKAIDDSKVQQKIHQMYNSLIGCCCDKNGDDDSSDSDVCHSIDESSDNDESSDEN